MMKPEITPLIIGEIGSFAHGLNVATSDHDYIGIYTEGPEAVIGLSTSRHAIRGRDKPEGIKSEAGDSEATYYNLRHYALLAAEGNPTVLTLLYTPTLIVPDTIGIQAERDMFLSKRLAARHIGYANNMEARLTGQKAPRANRPELVAAHGYDTKAAFHAIRLLMQGYELLTEGTMQMPMREDRREYLLAIRNGEVSQEHALTSIGYYRERIKWAEHAYAALPPEPDYGRINEWLIRVYTEQWELAG